MRKSRAEENRIALRLLLVFLAVSAGFFLATSVLDRSPEDDIESVKQVIDLPPNLSDFQSTRNQRQTFVKFTLDYDTVLSFVDGACGQALRDGVFPFEPGFTPPGWWQPETVQAPHGVECIGDGNGSRYEILVDTQATPSVVYLRITPM